MDDEGHATNQASPESPVCSKNKNNSSSSTASKEQDRFLLIANVGRIMKKVVPGNGKISKDAKETVQECVSEFISFVTGEASDKCQREKRKTINGDDIIWAITTLGFEDYVNPLKIYLAKYREIEGEKINVPKQQQQQRVDYLSQSPRRLFDQFQQIDCGASNSIYSTHNTLLLPPPPPPNLTQNDQQFNLPFSPVDSIPRNYPHPEQIDSVGHW